MSTPAIRDALERLVELRDADGTWGLYWDEAIAAARAALAQQEAEGATDPRCCDCGALWLDVPLRMDEGQTQRGNSNGGPTTPKPPIKPKPQFPPARKIREGFL
jgi:hypothetical protein